MACCTSTSADFSSADSYKLYQILCRILSAVTAVQAEAQSFAGNLSGIETVQIVNPTSWAVANTGDPNTDPDIIVSFTSGLTPTSMSVPPGVSVGSEELQGSLCQKMVYPQILIDANGGSAMYHYHKITT